MKQLFFFICLLLSAPQMSAQSLKVFWLATPDTIIPYLNADIRTKLLESKQKGSVAKEKNLFGNETVLDTITADFLHVSLSEMSNLSIRRLPLEGGDSIFCVVRTYYGDKAESTLTMYNSQWENLKLTHIYDKRCIRCVRKSLIAKPDTMTDERFAELKALVDPLFVEAMLSVDSDELTFTPSAPMLNATENTDVKAILVQRKFKWDGKMFKNVRI